ncbi:MAG: dephospho-CoA kinase [Crocinitomicaceae bacterium]|jgi:dephospho-CoA kinase
MLKIGITGGIGSGKSYVCQILEKMGYAIFYSDLEAKKLMIQNKELIQKIKNIIGEHAYLDNELNKPIIRNFLFQNEVNKEKLNAIIHPFVYQEFEKWTNTIQKEIVFNESALLFETNSYKRFNKTILVTAPEEIRIQRLIKRDSINTEEIKKRFDAQLNDSIKRKKADFIIENDDKKLIIPQINKMLEQIRR